jgi:membrane fusion protein (multidrug efflux system)
MHAPKVRRAACAAAMLSALVGATAALAQGGAPPPPQVTTVTLEERAVPLTFEYAGRISAYRNVEVRARVSGILLSRNFTEGEPVKEGQLLYRIDPAPYEATLARAQAQLQQEQATLERREKDLERAQELLRRKSGTEKAFDDATADVALSKALVAAAEAQVKTAQLDLGYTTVNAPLAGTTSLDTMDEGSLVGTTADNSLLTRITQLDPAYVNFSFTDRELGELRQLYDSGRADRPEDGTLKAAIEFGDGTTYDKEGSITFTDVTIDQQTGTIRARAEVPNPDRKLLPGQFVRVIVNGVTLNAALVVPQAAVMQGPQGPYVYAVDAESKAVMKPIELGREVEGGWIVEKGLASGDRIITEGVIKVRPGAPVTLDAPAAVSAAPADAPAAVPAASADAPVKKAEADKGETVQ